MRTLPNQFISHFGCTYRMHVHVTNKNISLLLDHGWTDKASEA